MASTWIIVSSSDFKIADKTNCFIYLKNIMIVLLSMDTAKSLARQNTKILFQPITSMKINKNTCHHFITHDTNTKCTRYTQNTHTHACTCPTPHAHTHTTHKQATHTVYVSLTNEVCIGEVKV